MKLGKIISFEGISCAGKSTLIKKFEKYLNTNDINYVLKHDLTQFNGTANSGQQTPVEKLGTDIKALLNKYSAGDLFFRFGFPDIETFLILSKRAFEARVRLVPALQKGLLVICDRDIDTVCSHQLTSLYADNPELNVHEVIKSIRLLNNISIPSPSLTFYLEANIEICSDRSKMRGTNVFTEEQKNFLIQAKNFYNVCFSKRMNGRRLIRIDAVKNQEEILSEVIFNFEKWHQKVY